MIKTLTMTGIVYGVLAIAVGIIDLVRNLEEGETTNEAVLDAIWTGTSWPISVVNFLW